MDPIVDKSSNTLANGGTVASSDIPQDGTGTVPTPTPRRPIYRPRP